LLTAANALHGSIDGVAASAPDVYNIVGCSEPTISGYRIYDNGVVDVSRDAGDGTVPLVSAMDRADGFKNYFISGDKTGITHASLVSDSRTLALITAILNGAASFTLPDGFSTSSSSCFGGSTVEFSAHGASGLMIQNNTGLSTGLDASGTVELGIPDSTYDAIGDNYFVIVPGDGAYHVTTESSSSDDLVVKAKGYDGSSVTQTATYVVSSSVPEGQGTGIGTTTVMLDFSDFNSAANVTVTENGNANSSSSSQNTSSTFSLAPTIEASASDIVPPDITISGIPTSAVEGNTTTVSFSAIDTDSGIASLKATLNGVPVGNGDVVTFAQEGDNVFRVEAMDGAGNPTAREVDFAVSAPKPTSSPVAAPPREISFSPIEDTYIDAADSDVNYGGSSVLRLRARGKNRAFAKFDQAAIENAVGSNTIVSANLAFTVAKNWENWAASGLLTLHRMTSPWIESGATWNSVNVSGTASWILEPSAMTTVSNDTTSTISLDVTTDVRAFLNGTEDDGWILQKADECAPGVIDFGSRESETPPVLTVTYVSLK
jgi:hypothetical protein